MTQRFFSPRFVAASTLTLATVSVLAAACGSDKRSEGTDGNMLTPDPSASAGGTGGSGAGGDTSSPSANAGTAPVSTGGSEMQPGDTPIDPGMAGSGSGGGDTAPPPPQTVTANCTPPEGDVPALALTLVADGLNQPLYVTGAPGDDSRLFVLEKGGTVRVLVDGALQEQPFADISNQVVNEGEMGLLGLAFHPQYATNGLFYLHYSSTPAEGGVTEGDGVVVELSVDSANRSVANGASQRRVLVVAQPAENHNGGEITFGPDGFLYLGFGDGGGQNDPSGNGQNLNTLLAKLLRIDPLGRDVANAYSIPPGNMVAAPGQQLRGEVWAYGLRNPWRFSFDACNGDLYIGDVGQNAVEEIDYLPANTPAGANLGWRIMEGPNCFMNNAACAQGPAPGVTLPVDSYGRGVGSSVTGGYVYRGSDVPGLRGYYIYADYASARFFRFRVDNGQIADRQEITAQLLSGMNAGVEDIASFGTDNGGEVYVAAFEPGAVYQITAAP